MPYLMRVAIAILLPAVFYSGSLAAEPDLSAARDEALALYRAGRAADAAAAFDKLSRESPADDSLRLWKALARLEQARQMRDAKADGYKAVVERSYAELKTIARREWDNPEWCYAMAKAYWLNNRPEKAEKMLKKAFSFRQDFPEAFLLQGDIEYWNALDDRWDSSIGKSANKVSEQYGLALNSPAPRPDLRAEACYKMGLVESVLRKKTDSAHDWWEKAVAAAPGSMYGKLAQEKLVRGKPGPPAGGKP